MAVSKGNPLKSRMDKAMFAMKNKEELEYLKSMWGQGSCTDASDTHRPTLVTLVNVVVIIVPYMTSL